MMDYEIRALTPEEAASIEEKILAYADTMAPPEPHTEEKGFVFKAEDAAGAVAGGCILNVHSWGRAVLACLWVDERHRGQGLGSMLIRTAEQAAREKGCYYLCLGTYDFMARPLYEKHGFRVFTVNRDVPPGHDSWSLSKRLDRNVPDYVPQNNSAVTKYTVSPGTKEDARRIEEGLDRYCSLYEPDEHEDVDLSRKLVGADGRLLAGVVADVDSWNLCALDGVWVEEGCRLQGLGSRLLREVEREAKENGACVVQTYACDWTAGFFFQNGYTVRGKLEDYPRGHCAYELEKRL